MVGFQTGRGRVVPAPSKQAVQHALEGLSAADFMSSPDRTALAPESPTPLTRGTYFVTFSLQFSTQVSTKVDLDWFSV